jgi:phage FluMu protein Com
MNRGQYRPQFTNQLSSFLIARANNALLSQGGFGVDDKVKMRCPGCKQMFREKASRVREGVQVNCMHCNKLITLSRESDDSYVRRAIKTAKDLRVAQEAARAAATYKGAANAPPRDL